MTRFPVWLALACAMVPATAGCGGSSSPPASQTAVERPKENQLPPPPKLGVATKPGRR